MPFHVLNPDLVRHLLQGEVDELTSANDARLEKIRKTPCPRCGASLHPIINARDVFSSRDPLPRLLATCNCGFEQDAETGLIVDRGSAMKVEDPYPIIKVDED